MRSFNSNLVFVDLMMNLLVGFVSLFILAFLLINPIADDGKIDPITKFMLQMEWDQEAEGDIDIWVRGPDGTLLSFGKRDQRYMVLDRDDRGTMSDTFEINGEETVIKKNVEVVNINGIVPGEYVINAHYFGNAPSAQHIENVTLTLWDMTPFKLVLELSVPIRARQELTMISFVVTPDGQIVDMNTNIKIKLVNIIVNNTHPTDVQRDPD